MFTNRFTLTGTSLLRIPFKAWETFGRIGGHFKQATGTLYEFEVSTTILRSNSALIRPVGDFWLGYWSSHTPDYKPVG